MGLGVRVAAAVLAVAAVSAGCGGRDYGWEGQEQPKTKPAAAKKAEAAEFERKAKAAWEMRDQEPKLRQAIDALKRLLEAKGGKDYGTLVWLSRAHYVLGELQEESEKKLEAYDAGMRFGDLALNTIPAFRARFEKEQAVEKAVEAVGKEGIDAIYWDAVNVGKWANTKGKVKVLFMKDKVKRMVERVEALDDAWFFGAAHRYLGAYYSALPGFAGRDLEASRKHFERAKAIEPRYFTTRVLTAEYYARTANDRKLYRSELEYVLATPPEVLPAYAPEQRIEQRKARRLLDEIDDHFDEEEPAEAEPKPAGAPPAEGAKGGS